MASFDDYLYGRISEDEVGTEKGVTRQLRDVRERSEVTLGRVVGEFSDNDISALKGAQRPGFDRLMAAVTAPNPDKRQRRIIVVHTSRLWRNRTERAHGIDTLGRARLIIHPIHGPELNLTTAAGRMVAGMLGEVDTGESETKAERIQDAARERAYEGRTNAGVLYGWSRVYQYDSRGKVVGFDDVVDEAQAAVVREIVRRLLSGESLLGVTESLNARGIPAPGAGRRRKARAAGQSDDGSKWGKTSTKKLALRPANIGLRIFHRGRPDEELLPAAWPAIIDFADHDRVVALLTDPARAKESLGHREHLLTHGIGACGVCGGRLRTSRKGHAKYGQKEMLYICEASGHVGRNLANVNALVDKVMIGLLSREDSLQLLDGTTELATQALRRAANHRARLDAAARDYADGLIEAGQLKVITSRLKPQIEEAEAQAAVHQTNPYAAMAATVVGVEAEQKWQAMTVLQKRAVLRAFGVEVVIDKVAKRGAGFDPASVHIAPRGQGG